MRADVVPLGVDPPEDVNVVVTVAAGAAPLRVDVTADGLLEVVQLHHTAMRVPGTLGILPRTRVGSASPLVALVLGEHAIGHGLIVGVRPVGVLYVSSEGVPSERSDEVTLLAVPTRRLSTRHDAIASYTDLPTGELRRIANFFERYRDVEEGGRQRTSGWGDVSEAHRVVMEAAARARRPVT
ncbi:inorganic diphosphatase [Acuticoccus sp.]|uniref:inorganic diphosphatase n=1 Tax=Acuticoccus sp. TaxID=1904378 RepID=UPI003B52A097